jgi:hypothetical protein
MSNTRNRGQLNEANNWLPWPQDRTCNQKQTHKLVTVTVSIKNLFILFYFWCLMPLSAIFQLYHGDQF